MAARKRKKPSPGDDFSNTPFTSLKGVPVSDASPPPPKRQASPPSSRKNTINASDDDPALFEQEMGWLGVRRLAEEPYDRHGDAGDRQRAKPDPPHSVDDADDTATFLQAMQGVDVTSMRDSDVDDQIKPTSPRRQRQVKRGQVRPEAELDLHGMTRDEALTRVDYFLDNARHHGCRAVLIITGKGGRADGASVLRTAVGDLLSSERERVLEWFEAPRQYGGRGALVVFLRHPRGD